MKIDWLNLIRLHKEITKRSEIDFFSLPPDNGQTERYSYINNLTEPSLEGPWEFNFCQIENKNFKLILKSRNFNELFLCMGNFVIRGGLYPFFYTQVKPEIFENKIIFTPEQTKWEISPFFIDEFQKVDSLDTEKIEELNIKIIKHLNNKSLLKINEEIIFFIKDYYPEIIKSFNNIQNQIFDFLIFQSPNKFSKFNTNLMRDFGLLENILIKNPDQIGGLKLFSLDNKYEKKKNEILPIVPINESQKKAVQDILEGKNISVISGPPGCGKSQVVLSVLLNSWASGESVLFASNNNQAVNVVRERLKPFESIIPIIVRAGSQKENNIIEVLDNIFKLNKSILKFNKIDPKSFESSKNKLLKEKDFLEDYLKVGVPQRIDEIIKSTIKAFSKTKSIDLEIENKNKKLSADLQDIGKEISEKIDEVGFKIVPEEFEAKILKPFNGWLKELDEIKCNYESEKKIELRELHNKELIEKNTLRSFEKYFIKDTQFDFNTNRNYLKLIESFKIWFNDLNSILEEPIENNISEFKWSKAYDRWNDLNEINFFHSTLIDIRNKIKDFIDKSEDFEFLNEKIILVEEVKSELKKYKIDISKKIDHSIIKEWLENYKEFKFINKNFLDFLPWSKKNTFKKKLDDLEKIIIKNFDTTTLDQFGYSKSIAGKEKLLPFIQIIDKYFSVIEELIDPASKVGNLKVRIDYTCKLILDIKMNAGELNYNKILWQNFFVEINQQLKFSEIALKQWKLKERIEIYTKKFKQISNNLINMEIDELFERIFSKNTGKDIRESLNNLTNNIKKENLVSFRKDLNKFNLNNFINLINDLGNLSKQHKENREILENLRVESDFYDIWWQDKPKEIKVFIDENKKLPEKDSYIFEFFKLCNIWFKNYLEIINFEIPKLLTAKMEEIDFIKQELPKIILILKNDPNIENIEKELNNFINNVENSYNIDPERIINLFLYYRPDLIKQKIGDIDSKLEGISFDQIKFNWAERVSNDNDLKTNLSFLINHYQNNGLKIKPEAYNCFKKILEAIPIWITTANSCQSIPLEPDLFDLLIVDEGTQCTLTNLLPLIYRAKKIAVIGDPEQLPAITKISNAVENSLADNLQVKDLLDKFGHVNNNLYKTAVNFLESKTQDIILLEEHYRCHPLIIGFSNYFIYKNVLKLKKDPGLSSIKENGIFGKDVRGQAERESATSSSWHNLAEADQVIELVGNLRAENNNIEIGVVSPFRDQVKIITSKLENLNLLENITIGTAHNFQGDERDIMIFSPVVSKNMSQGSINWVQKPHNLINVALTRAKDALFIVCDFGFLSTTAGILKDLVNYVKTIELLRNTSLYELELFTWMLIQGWSPEVHVKILNAEVDFLLKNRGIKLVIEVDGSTHDPVIDKIRDSSLMASGYQVIRFPTRRISEEINQVLHEISEKMSFIYNMEEYYKVFLPAESN